MSKQGGIKDVALGRSDIYRMDPRDLSVKEGWNGREDDNPANRQHIEGLAVSIAAVGVKQPLTVYWEDGKAYVSDGHCRLKATLLALERGAEIKSIPVQTEDRYASEADRVFSQILRNSGKPLAPIEQGRVFKRLVDLGWSEKDIAEKAGINRAWVVELLELQAAPQEVTNLVNKGQVSSTLAITTLRKNKGDVSKTAADLNHAVETAHEQGKDRATAKHLSEKKPSLKAELKTMFEATLIREIPDGNYQVVLTADQYAALRSMVGF